MATSKRKRTQSTKAAANATETNVATVAKTARKKTSKQQPSPPTSYQTPRTVDTTVDTTVNTVEIPSSPPVLEPDTTTEQLPNRLEEFEYWVLQTAVTTSGACIWSKRAGPFANGLCSLVSIEHDILAGIKNSLGVALWDVTLKMA